MYHKRAPIIVNLKWKSLQTNDRPTRERKIHEVTLYEVVLMLCVSVRAKIKFHMKYVKTLNLIRFGIL